MTKKEFSLSSYYFDFEKTGCDHIGKILHAVARAGKVFHSTSQWQDEAPEFKGCLEGDTPQEWIQKAANEAAKDFGK